MKTLFSHYYLEDAHKLLEECKFIVLDTNILLDLFRLPPQTADNILSIFVEYKDKLHIPFHVACEYHKHAHKIMHEQSNKYIARSKTIRDFIKQMQDDENDVRAHPYMDKKDVSRIKQQLSKASDLYCSLGSRVIDEEKRRFLNIADFFQNKVVEKDLTYINDRAKSDAQVRQQNGIPLNLENKKDNQYGDLIIWYEIIDFLSENGNAIFITNDREWFLEISGKTVCPHPYLRNEYRLKAGNSFYCYKLQQFISLHAELNDKNEQYSKTIEDIDYFNEFLARNLDKVYHSTVKIPLNVIRRFRETSKITDSTFLGQAESANITGDNCESQQETHTEIVGSNSTPDPHKLNIDETDTNQ